MAAPTLNPYFTAVVTVSAATPAAPGTAEYATGTRRRLTCWIA